MTVGILGLGLIGGSLARAYKKAGHTVLVYDRDESMLDFSQLAGVVDAPLNSDNLPSCDLILLAIFADASALWLEQNAEFISADALVIDCCGIKKEICREEF